MERYFIKIMWKTSKELDQLVIIHCVYRFFTPNPRAFQVWEYIQEVPYKLEKLRLLLVQLKVYYKEKLYIRCILHHCTYMQNFINNILSLQKIWNFFQPCIISLHLDVYDVYVLLLGSYTTRFKTSEQKEISEISSM